MIDQALWALGRGTGITALAFMTVALFLGIATRSGRPLLMLPRFAVADVQRDIVDDRNALVALGHLIEGDGHIFRKGCDRKTDKPCSSRNKNTHV